MRDRWVGAVALALVATTTGTATAVPARPHSLASRQVHRIVKMTGYHGLRSHRFEVAATFRAGGVNTEVVRLDGAGLAVSMPALHRDLGLAAKLAAERRSFTSTIRTSSRHTERITFHVAPADVLEPRAPYIRYIIFTRQGQRLSNLTRPQHVPAIQALTVIDAAHRINVTLQQDRAKSATWGPGIPAAGLLAMVEGLNTSSFVFLTPKTTSRLTRHHVDPNQMLAIGREIWSNSLGFAIMSARRGTSYHTYSRQASKLRFNIYRDFRLRYLTTPSAQYQHFA